MTWRDPQLRSPSVAAIPIVAKPTVAIIANMEQGQGREHSLPRSGALPITCYCATY